jgi:hypothetical protein
MKKIGRSLSIFFLFVSVFANCQNRYFTREGIIYFNLEYLGETISISNSNLSCSIENDKFNFTSQTSKFKFNNSELKNKIIASHVDSLKIKGASIKGELDGFNAIDFTKNNSYKLILKGTIVINKQEKNIELPITLKVIDKVAYLKSVLYLNINDFIFLEENNALKKNDKVAITLDFALNPLR